MIRAAKRAGLCVLAGAFLAGVPAGAAAQQGVIFEGRAGVGFPVGTLGDVVDPGFSAGITLGYRLTPGLTAVAATDLETLPGTGGAEDLTLFHYRAGLEARLTDPLRTYWRLSLHAGLGATTFDAAGPAHTYFTTSGGLKLGYNVNAETDLYVSLEGLSMQADEEEQGFGTVWSLPLTAGARLLF